MAFLTFDAAGSNVDGTNPGTALNIGPGAPYKLRSFSAPAPPQTVQYAGSVDTEGSRRVSAKHENRTISMEIMCDTTAALQALQAKIGKVARETGTLKWTLPNGTDTVICDLLAVDTFEPTIDILYYANGGINPVVSISLPALPYGRGSEITLSDHVETTLPLLIFTETGIKGDVPALGRLVVDNDQAAATQLKMLWGIQSFYYSSASTAALYYEAESCAQISAAAAVGPAGASGGGSNTSKITLGSASTWTQMHYIGASSTAQTHLGDFRVFARVQIPAANTGVTSIRCSWLTNGSASTINNTATVLQVTTGVIEDAWVIADLGQISLRKPRNGSIGWLGTIDAFSTVIGDIVYVDHVFLIPVTEGSGEITFAPFGSAMLQSGQSATVAHDYVEKSVTGGYWGGVLSNEGDYLLVPPAGAEARSVRFIVKLTRGVTGPTDPPPNSIPTGGFVGDVVDDLSARLSYTPRYLVLPSP